MVNKRDLIFKVFMPILLVLAILVSFAGQATPVFACYINSVTTNPATNVTSDSATLNGSVDVANSSNITTCSFEYGLTNSYGLTTPGDSKTGDKAFSSNISNLTPNTLYHFRAKAVESPQYISYGIDHTFTTLATYTVDFEAGDNGTLTGTTGFSDILNGTVWAEAVTVPTPVADAGYKFDAWSPIFPETVTESATYTANFVNDDSQWFTVNFEAGDNGTLTGTASFSDILNGTVWAEVVTVPTPVADAGYKFDAWSPSFPETVTESATYTANFVNDDSQWFTVDFEAGDNGTLTGTAGFSDILNGTAWAEAVTAPTPVADASYKFDAWSPIFPETVTESATYTANFVNDDSQWFTVDFEAGDNGTLIGTASFSDILKGTAWAEVVTAPTPVADAGYKFDAWSPIFSETVTESATYTANFVNDDSQWFTVNFEAGDHGTLTGTAGFSDILNGTVWGEAVTAPTPAADAGYKFDAWSPNFPETVTESATYSANFTKNGGGGGGGYSGGDGGGVYTIPAGIIAEVVPEIDYFTVDFQGRITRAPVSSEGAILNSIYAPSPDGAHLFSMPQGTLTLDKTGNIVKLITIRDTQMPPLTQMQVSLGLAYDFEPSGVTFSQPVVITLGYDLDQVPSKIESIGLSYYSESGWISLAGLPGTIAEAGKASAPVQHFSTYAVIANKLPASFKASNLVIKPSKNTYWQGLPFIIVKGDKAEISVEVLNTGGDSGDYTGVLKLNEKALSQQVITLVPDQNGKIVFNATELKSGNYRVEIGGLTGTLSSALWINWWLIIGLIIALAAVIWIITFVTQRKKKLVAKK